MDEGSGCSFKKRYSMSASAILACVCSVFFSGSVFAGVRHPVDLGQVGVGSVPGVRIDKAALDPTGGLAAAAGDVNGDGIGDIIIGARLDGDPLGVLAYLI